MTRTSSELINVALGLGAVAYSFMPLHHTPRGRRGLALLLRAAGLTLLLIAGTSMLIAKP